MITFEQQEKKKIASIAAILESTAEEVIIPKEVVPDTQSSSYDVQTRILDIAKNQALGYKTANLTVINYPAASYVVVDFKALDYCLCF